MHLKILVLLLLVCFSYSKAEEIDTGNILDPADEWTLEDKASITQCSYSGTLEDGEVCTGSADNRGEVSGGGKIISDEYSLINQGLTIDEIQQGFDYTYGSIIESHVSNTNVLSCNSTNGDCKDYFTITLNLSDQNGTIFKTHEHTVEMDYQGQQTYEYLATLDSNLYEDVSFQIDIWSVDAGYTNGYYGGIISNPFLSIQYQTVEIITDIITDIVNDIVFEEIEFEEVSFEVVIEDFFQDDLTFEFDFAPVEQAPIEIEMVEVEEIQLEIQAEFEEQLLDEMPEMEEISEPEEIEEVQEEIVEEVVEETPEEVEEEQEEIAPAEIKQKIANKLMASQKDKMSTEAQTTTLALMVILADTSFDSYLQKQIIDGAFYKDVGLVDQNVIIDYQAGILGYMDYGKINEMVDSQWK
jgi:hypothetical protein